MKKKMLSPSKQCLYNVHVKLYQCTPSRIWRSGGTGVWLEHFTPEKTAFSNHWMWGYM